MISSDSNKDVREDSENYHSKKYVHETILKELDDEEDKKHPNEFEKNLINKENKQMLITLANEKWPPVSYRETFEDKSFPESKFFIYNLATYVVPLYDGAGEKLPQSALDGDTGRGAFICKALVILAIQLVCTILFMIGGVFIKLSDDFYQTNHTGIVCICSIAFVLYCMLYFWPWSRKTFPCNYIILTTFTLCSIYALGSFHGEFNDPMNLLYTICGVLGILLILFILAFIPFFKLTSSRFYAILNQILPFMFITFLIASIYSLHDNVLFLLLIFLVIYLILECFFILHLFQLMLGRGGSHAMRTDEHILISVILYIHINTIHIILLILLSVGPYALLSLAMASRLGGLAKLFPLNPSVNLYEGASKLAEGASKASQGASKVSQGASKLPKGGQSKLSEGIAAINKTLNIN